LYLKLPIYKVLIGGENLYFTVKCTGENVHGNSWAYFSHFGLSTGEMCGRLYFTLLPPLIIFTFQISI